MSLVVQESFDRIATLKVFQRSVSMGLNGPELTPLDPVGRSFSSRQKDDTPGFRIKFRVEKTKEGTPNSATISIYNLGPLSRSFFRHNSLIILEAGYGNSSGLIFHGIMSRAVTRKEGPDYVTTIEAGDGLFASQNSNVDISFRTAIPAQAAITTLVGILKGGGVDPGQIVTPKPDIYNAGLVLSGKTVDRLREICEKNDLEFSIQDGKVTILPFGTPALEPLVVLSSGALGFPNTGLIGIPEIRSPGTIAIPPQQGEPSVISLKSLLNYNIGVYRLIQVVSKFVNGTYHALKVVHDGDTWSGPWYTEIEASGPGIPEVT